MDYLSNLEKDKLALFLQDETMVQAVKKVLLEGIYQVGTLSEGKPASDRNWAYNLGGLNDFSLDDAKLGNLLKVTTRALAIVEDRFKTLEKDYKKDPEEIADQGNKAL